MLVWELFLAAILTLVALAGARKCRPLLRLLRIFARRLQHRTRYSRPKRCPRTHLARVGLSRLSVEDREGFVRAWQSVSKRFETDPGTAIVYADLLIADLIHHLECPGVHGPARRVLLHEGVLEDKYRAAHELAFHEKHLPTGVGEFRQAMILYQSLFEQLLGEQLERVPDYRSLSFSQGHGKI